MKFKLLSCSLLLTTALTACNAVPNRLSPLLNQSPNSAASKAKILDPATAPVVSVDRFQDGIGKLFNRNQPIFDPENLSKVIPDPNEAINMDKLFLLKGLGPNGQKVTYYALDIMNPDKPGKAWVLMDAAGNKIQGQLPIINAIPGNNRYSDYVQIVEVTVPDDYQANQLTSKTGIEAAASAGEVTLKETSRIGNWPVVPKGTIANQKFDGRSVSGYTAWHNDQVAHYLKFEELQMTGNGQVPVSEIVVIFKNGMDPSMGFKAEADGQTHNVLATVPGQAGYSSLWIHTVQGNPDGFDAVKDFQTAKANATADGPGATVNCPVVTP